MYDMVKFERGQVWVIRFKDPGEAKGHEQNKDRPWLVVSTSKYMHTSKMITAVPISSQDKAYTPAHVTFYNQNNTKNCVMCEQIRSFDTSSGAYTLDYLGCLSDAIMEKVDVALSIHLGMHYSPITLKALQESVDAVVKSVGYMQEKANTPKFTDSDVEEFATKLEERAKANLEVTVEASATPVTFDARTSPEVEVVTSKKPSRTPRRVWTTDKINEYLKDCDTLTMKAIMEKWHMRKQDVYSTKAYLKRKLQ